MFTAIAVVVVPPELAALTLARCGVPGRSPVGTVLQARDMRMRARQTEMGLQLSGLEVHSTWS